MNAFNCRFDFQDILLGFQQQQVSSALDQAKRLLTENIRKRVVADIGHLRVVGGDELAGRTNRTRHKTRFRGRAKAIRYAAC